MPTFSEYLENTNEDLRRSLTGRQNLPPQPPNISPELAAAIPPSYQLGGQSPADIRMRTQQMIAAGHAAQQYRMAMEAQADRELAVELTSMGVGLVGGALGSLVAPGIGTMAGYMAGQSATGWLAGIAGLNDPEQLYDREDYIKSIIAENISTAAFGAIDPFSYGQFGMTMGQSTEMSETMYDVMRGYGFAGPELGRMLPMLGESGLLRPAGMFSGAEEALDDFERRIERFASRISEVVRHTSLDVEEATALTIRETMLAGDDLGMPPGGNQLYESMQYVSGATGMSYDESTRFMTGTLGPWAGTQANLLPFMEEAGTQAGIARLAETQGAWGTAWRRAGGAAAVAGQYAAYGNQYWMREREDLAQLYASNQLNRSVMMDMAAGEGLPENLVEFDTEQQRLEAQYYGRQALAEDPYMAQAAAFGFTVEEMIDDEITSRPAQIEWLVENRRMAPAQAAAWLDLHERTATREGRLGAYLGGMRTQVSERQTRREQQIQEALGDAMLLSGEQNPYWSSFAREQYRVGYDDEGYVIADHMDYVHERLDQENRMGIFGPGAGHVAPGEPGERRMDLANAATTIATRLDHMGHDDATQMSGRIMWDAVAKLSPEAFESLQVNIGAGMPDENVLDLLATTLYRREHGQEDPSWVELLEYKNKIISMSPQELEGLADETTVDLWEYGGREGGVRRTEDVNLGDIFRGEGPTGLHLNEEYVPDIMANIMKSSGEYDYTISQDSVAALEQIYATTPAEVAGRGMRASLMGTTVGRRYMPEFEYTAQRQELAGDLVVAQQAVAVLEGIPEEWQAMAEGGPRQDQYVDFLEEAAEKELSIRQASQGLNPRNYEDQVAFRDNLAQEMWGVNYLQLDSQQKNFLEEWIMTNDPSAAPGSGDQNWGGQHDEVLESAREAWNESALDYVDYEGLQGGVIAQQEARIQRTLEYETFQEAGLTREDVALYGQLQIAYQVVQDEDATREQREEAREVIARTEEQLTPEQTHYLHQVYGHLGAPGVTSGQLYGIMARYGTGTDAEMLAAEADLEGKEAMQAVGAALRHRDVEALPEGISPTSQLGLWQADKISYEEMFEGIGLQVPEGTPEETVTGGEGDEGRIGREFDDRTLRVQPAGDAMPVTIVEGGGALGLIRGMAERLGEIAEEATPENERG